MAKSTYHLAGSVVCLIAVSARFGCATSATQIEENAKSTNNDLAFAVVAKSADPYAIQTDFVMADDLLKDLQTLQNVWSKKDDSKIALCEGSAAAHYVEGVYQAWRSS